MFDSSLDHHSFASLKFLYPLPSPPLIVSQSFFKFKMVINRGRMWELSCLCGRWFGWWERDMLKWGDILKWVCTLSRYDFPHVGRVNEYYSPHVGLVSNPNSTVLSPNKLNNECVREIYGDVKNSISKNLHMGVLERKRGCKQSPLALG